MASDERGRRGVYPPRVADGSPSRHPTTPLSGPRPTGKALFCSFACYVLVEYDYRLGMSNELTHSVSSYLLNRAIFRFIRLNT